MKSFVYFVEMILIAIILFLYLFYTKPLNYLQEGIKILEKKYLLDSLGNFIINLEKANLLDIFKISYLLYSNRIDYFSQNLEIIDILEINTIPTDCLAFLYPFPNFDDLFYRYNNLSNIYFHITDFNGNTCKNLSISDDWFFTKISHNYLNKFSLKIKDISLENLDPYSIFIFDSNGNMIKIINVSYDNNFLNLSILFDERIFSKDLFILFRIKENSSEPNLEYLERYNVVTSIETNEILLANVYKSNWLTIYINDKCLNESKFLLIYYAILPNEKYLTEINNIEKNLCKGNYRIKYSLDEFFKYYSIEDLESLKVLKNPVSSKYENILLFIKGLSLNILKIYGS